MEGKVNLDIRDIKTIRTALNTLLKHQDNAHLMDALMAVDRIEEEYDKFNNHTKSLTYRLDIDTSEAQRKLKELKMMSGCIGSMLNEHARQPHVRIEFDDIAGVPKVWIDGKRVDDPKDSGLVELCIDWHTNTADSPHKRSYAIKTISHRNDKFFERTESQETHG